MLTAVSRENAPCSEKKRLMTQYHTATSRFHDVVAKLQREMGALWKDEYDHVIRYVDEARIKSEESRVAIDRHVSTHGC